MNATATGMAAPLEQRPTGDEIAQQVQASIRDAVRSAREAAQAAEQTTRQAPQGVIDALRAEIQAQKAEIDALTNQLTQGQSQARIDAVNQRLDDARERLQTLQGQLDRALGAPEPRAITVQPPFQDEIPKEVLPLTITVMASFVFIIVGWPIARAWARRMDRKHVAPAPQADMSPRFDRIEQAIEAMAIEVERVSEGQRFTTKLMSEMRALPAPNPLNEFKGVAPRVGEAARREGSG